MPPYLDPPAIGILLDDSLIPSLAAPGQIVGHAALMGRSRAPLPKASSSVPSGPPVPPKDINALRAIRPGMMKRSSSFGDDMPVHHSSETIRKTSLPDHATLSQDRLRPPRPSMVRRTSSFEGPAGVRAGREKGHLPLPGKVRARQYDLKAKGHSRSSSDTDTYDPPSELSVGSHAKTGWPVPAFIDSFEGGIALGTDRELASVSKILMTLGSLVPPSRQLPGPPPASGVLHPPTLLLPLSIILEALVMERSILRGETPRTRLPTLPAGGQLQTAGGHGELDWQVMKAYALAVGSMLSSLMPLLQRHQNQNEVDSVIRGVKAYISKQKKVFGHVAAMYVEGYSSMRGWWDESGMKASAREIGRWGDLM